MISLEYIIMQLLHNKLTQNFKTQRGVNAKEVAELESHANFLHLNLSFHYHYVPLQFKSKDFDRERKKHCN
jgi:hypothetical protein